MHSFGDWYRRYMRDADGVLITMDEGRKDDMRTAYEAGVSAERARLSHERDYAVVWANKAVQDVKEEFAGALWDIRAERQRQIDDEGWTDEHDDQHIYGEIARAAAAYADFASWSDASRMYPHRKTPVTWPWEASWWKPSDRRRDLVKAGALIVAEIERLDRAAIRKGGE